MSLPLNVARPPGTALTPAEDAIARSVLYSALFDYPLTLSQLRQTLVGSLLTATDVLGAVRTSTELGALVEHRDGFFFPAGRHDLIEVRRQREQRSRTFLAAHRPLLRLVAAIPYVRLVALSGSVAHLNLEAGGDLDLFIVTRGRRVWSTAVIVILLARLLGRRRTLCANFLVSDTALTLAPHDLFTANQIIGMKPVSGTATFRAILAANPFVRTCYPNYHGPDAGGLAVRQSLSLRLVRAAAEVVLTPASLALEWLCRAAYRRYLARRASTWRSPEQVVLADDRLKLHTRSHRHEVLSRFDSAVHDAFEA